MEKDGYSDSEIKEILSMKNVAVVGFSKNPGTGLRKTTQKIKKKGKTAESQLWRSTNVNVQTPKR